MTKHSTVLAKARLALASEPPGVFEWPASPVTVRCAYCSFAVSAPLEEAQESFERHECHRRKPTTSTRGW